MEKQLYLVENVLPKQKRARKALVYRWMVMASSSEEAIDLAVEASLREIFSEGPLYPETLSDERKRGTWTASIEGQVSRLSNRFTWH